MGYCQSSPNEDINSHLPNLNSDPPISSAPLSMADSMEIQDILSSIPVHCRQEIINLPARQLLKVYQHHLVGKYYFDRKNFLLALTHECRVMQGLLDMMPNHKGHFIFVDLCNVMSTCFLELHGYTGAVDTSQWALGIISKHTPTNYTAISLQYSRLATAYQASKAWREAGYCLTKTIETARPITNPDQEYIRQLDANLELIKSQIIDHTQVFVSIREVTPLEGESMEDMRCRAIAEMINYNAEHSTLSFDKAEFERLPNKQTESRVTDEILKDVLHSLENYLRNNTMAYGYVSCIAAQFKNQQMKTSSLSPTIIEAALTIIIDRIKDVNLSDNEQYTALKQSSFLFSYTDDDRYYKKGVRVFQIKRKTKQSDEQ